MTRVCEELLKNAPFLDFPDICGNESLSLRRNYTLEKIWDYGCLNGGCKAFHKRGRIAGRFDDVPSWGDEVRYVDMLRGEGGLGRFCLAMGFADEVGPLHCHLGYLWVMQRRNN